MATGAKWHASTVNVMPKVKYDKTHAYKPARFRYDDLDPRKVSTAPELPSTPPTS